MSRNGQIKHNLLASCATNPEGETDSGIEAPSFSVYLYGLGEPKYA